MLDLLRTTVLVACAATAALSHAQPRPYAGEQSRDIKALSAQETQQYLSGAGMGYAKPAELNSYPGPMHVLELAERLGLTPEQQTKTKALMEAHKQEARAIGAKVVAAERELDLLFRSKSVDRAALARAVLGAAEVQGSYRLSHLETHRRLRELLTADQVAQYDALRGYADTGSTHHRHGKP